MSSLLEGGDQNQPQLPPLKQFSTQVVSPDCSVDVHVSSFHDRDLVVVTSSRKLGTLVSVDVMTSQNRPSTYQLNVLFGRDDEATSVFARTLAQVIDNLRKGNSQQAAPGAAKPILCCVALKEGEFGVSRKVVEVLKAKCDVWC